MESLKTKSMYYPINGGEKLKRGSREGKKSSEVKRRSY